MLHRLEFIPSPGTCGLPHQKGKETMVQRPNLLDKGRSGLKWESRHLDNRSLGVPIPFSWLWYWGSHWITQPDMIAHLGAETGLWIRSSHGLHRKGLCQSNQIKRYHTNWNRKKNHLNVNLSTESTKNTPLIPLTNAHCYSMLSFVLVCSGRGQKAVRWPHAVVVIITAKPGCWEEQRLECSFIPSFLLFLSIK